MKKIFAIPTLDGVFCSHFGGCNSFTIIETEDNRIINEKYVEAPNHERGSFPLFLASLGVNTVIVGGMGTNAQLIFQKRNIEVCTGVNPDKPAKLVENYLKGLLKIGENLCDSDDHHHHH